MRTLLLALPLLAACGGGDDTGGVFDLGAAMARNRVTCLRVYCPMASEVVVDADLHNGGKATACTFPCDGGLASFRWDRTADGCYPVEPTHSNIEDCKL